MRKEVKGQSWDRSIRLLPDLQRLGRPFAPAEAASSLRAQLAWALEQSLSLAWALG